jgi:hypothetical protein
MSPIALQRSEVLNTFLLSIKQLNMCLYVWIGTPFHASQYEMYLKS